MQVNKLIGYAAFLTKYKIREDKSYGKYNL